MEIFSDFILRLYPIDYVPFKRKVFFHALFWGIIYIVFVFLSGYPKDNVIYRFLLATSITLYSVIFFYILAYLLPYLYEKYSGMTYIVSITMVIIAFYFFLAFESYIRVSLIIENNWLPLTNKIAYEENYNLYKAGFWSYFKIENILTDTVSTFFYSLPAFFLKFTRVFAKHISEKKQLEIDFLRMQISPHFLVNTLNNIFSLVVVKDQRSSDAILSLANLLNYVLYESSFSTVTLEKEISFLEDYVALETIRSSKVQVTMKVEGVLLGNIAPLILIAFIENAFKHGVGDSTIQSFININIKVEGTTLFLEVFNSKVRTNSKKHKQSLGGIGLVNVRKRLASLYPNRHNLQVISEPTSYQTLLMIQLT